MPRKTILITGANGLLGQALAQHLRAAGREVAGIDVGQPESDDIGTITVDVVDREAIHDLCARLGVGTIIHCGGISGQAVSRDDPHGTI